MSIMDMVGIKTGSNKWSKAAAGRTAKKAAATKATADAKTAKLQGQVDSADSKTVSGRITKSMGVDGMGKAMNQDLVAGAQFGEAVIGDGLGRIGEDKTMQGMESQAAELAKGFSSAEQLARKEKGLEAITGGTQAQSRAAQAAMARSGVKGQAAGAQLGNIAASGVQARGNMERDLMIANREAQMQGLQLQQGIHGDALTSQKFDIGQAAKEKDIALQAGLGFAQIGSQERGATAAAAASVKAARAGRQRSCFGEGTLIKLADGEFKKIEDIEITDRLEKGGIVYSLNKGITDEIYQYKGSVITGNHAVLEDGKWIRVKDSVKAFLFTGIFTVYNLSNENHRIITENGTEYADYDETDLCSSINDNESLEALNEERSKLLETGRGI